MTTRTRQTTHQPATDTSLRARAEEAYDGARERAVEAYDQARAAARSAGRSASGQVSEAPFIALGGGLALGALIAALLPTTRRERELLGPVTDRIRDTASAAAGAAREAGTARLGELGITRERGNDVFKQVVDGAADALRASAKAAASTVRGE
ncbi:hypothetical protein G7076_06315 [Sphingomonas sp. HDW15A]|uniref:hypothetical protein n=1 Tax=Sphingomonas sp. HDW15A TaxID=2714942 RepID=UPI00140A6771|nr:hypothetical protein [Sphingomonas sp. HDW15A]QIK96112.1 hypothetical protein G7076_06315 [Sphingomonas sp. HDW15A]